MNRKFFTGRILCSLALLFAWNVISGQQFREELMHILPPRDAEEMKMAGQIWASGNEMSMHADRSIDSLQKLPVPEENMLKLEYKKRLDASNLLRKSIETEYRALDRNVKSFWANYKGDKNQLKEVIRVEKGASDSIVVADQMRTVAASYINDLNKKPGIMVAEEYEKSAYDSLNKADTLRYLADHALTAENKVPLLSRAEGMEKHALFHLSKALYIYLHLPEDPDIAWLNSQDPGLPNKHQTDLPKKDSSQTEVDNPLQKNQIYSLMMVSNNEQTDFNLFLLKQHPDKLQQWMGQDKPPAGNELKQLRTEWTTYKANNLSATTPTDGNESKGTTSEESSQSSQVKEFTGKITPAAPIAESLQVPEKELPTLENFIREKHPDQWQQWVVQNNPPKGNELQSLNREWKTYHQKQQSVTSTNGEVKNISQVQPSQTKDAQAKITPAAPIAESLQVPEKELPALENFIREKHPDQWKQWVVQNNPPKGNDLQSLNREWKTYHQNQQSVTSTNGEVKNISQAQPSQMKDTQAKITPAAPIAESLQVPEKELPTLENFIREKHPDQWQKWVVQHNPPKGNDLQSLNREWKTFIGNKAQGIQAQDGERRKSGNWSATPEQSDSLRNIPNLYAVLEIPEKDIDQFNTYLENHYPEKMQLWLVQNQLPNQALLDSVLKGYKAFQNRTKADNKTTSTLSHSAFVYKVQVAACREKLSDGFLRNIYSGPEKITETFEDQWFKYIIGSFGSYEAARNLKEQSGVKKAFIVSYLNGKRFRITTSMVQSR